MLICTEIALGKIVDDNIILAHLVYIYIYMHMCSRIAPGNVVDDTIYI